MQLSSAVDRATLVRRRQIILDAKEVALSNGNAAGARVYDTMLELNQKAMEQLSTAPEPTPTTLEPDRMHSWYDPKVNF